MRMNRYDAGEDVTDALIVTNPDSGSYAEALERSRLGIAPERLLAHLAEARDMRWRALRLGDLGPGELEAAARGCSGRVIAAGGDGTVGAVADALIRAGASASAGGAAPVPLGIVPLGTANVLARELGLPMDWEGAAEVAMESSGRRRIDAIRCGPGGRHLLTQAGMGVDAEMIRATRAEEKRRLGRWAYILRAISGMGRARSRRFRIAIDGGAAETARATQVLIANCGTLGQRGFQWGPDIALDDGVMDVCAILARGWGDYLAVALDFALGRTRENPRVRYWKARSRVEVRTRRRVSAQADGESIGTTPLTFEMRAGCLEVVAPE